MDGNSIDFANSRSDSYRASNESVMDELNAYFKSYIAGHSDGPLESKSVHKETSPEEALEGIFDRAGFDDAMDMINHEKPRGKGSFGRSSSSSGSSSESDDSDNEDGHPRDGFNDYANGLLDVEILDQHIDKANLNGGSDATRAIENMAGGSLSTHNGPVELDDIDEHNAADNRMGDFASAMLGTDSINNTANNSTMNGGGYRKPSIDNSGSIRGYSGVTSEIRMKGNRVTERERKGSNYLSEDGYVDMAMLGGSFEDHAGVGNEGDDDRRDHEDPTEFPDGENRELPGYGKGSRARPIAEDPRQTPSEIPKIDIEDETVQNDQSLDEYSDFDIDPSSDSDELDADDPSGQPGHHAAANMASEIDHVLNQLRNKTARTLTGGTVNIRKKVVLTDMYPYIIRT